MFINQIGLFSSFMLPLLNADGGGGGGMGDGGGAGADPGAGGGTGATGVSGGGTDDPLDIDENRLIRVKGQDKPIKFGDYARNFQAQWTKSAQEAARLRAALQEREARIQAIERERQAAQAQNRGQQPDVYDALRKLPYLTGEAAVEVVQSIADQIKQRDMVQLATLKRLQQVQSVVNQLHGNHQSQAWEGKIQRWLKEGGYPEQAADLAKEIYLAYEGDDLDQEFPTIFKNRWEQIQRILQADRDRKAEEARRQPFVPGKGGNGRPSKPMQLDPKMNARQVADELWESLQVSET